MPLVTDVNFHLYRTYEIDTTEISTRDSRFTRFEQVYDLDRWKKRGMFRRFTFPDFDFSADDYQDKYLAVSFGREVLEMEAIGTYNNSIEVAITYAEEYHDNTMFLYIMDKVSLREDVGSEFYIMDGADKVFVGYDDLDIDQ